MQRKVILQELRRSKTHPTADEIFAMVRCRLPKVSLGTVYRNLEKMSVEGMIRKIKGSGSKKRFDATIENHYHIRCINCGKFEDLHGIRFLDLESLGKELKGYKVKGYNLELMGICPHCFNKNKRSSK